MVLCPFFSVSFLKTRIVCYVTTVQLNVGNLTWTQYLKKTTTTTTMYIPLLSLVPILSFLASPPPSPNSGSCIVLSQTVSLFFCYFGRTFNHFLFVYDAGIFGEHGPVNLESVPQLGFLGLCFLTVWFNNACLAWELQKGHEVPLWVTSKATWCPSAPHWWA